MNALIRYSVAPIMLLCLVVGSLVYAQPAQIMQRPTLPPSWTPTFTATATDTPTVTDTPTTTPTRTLEEICDEFIVGDNWGDGYRFNYNRDFTLFIGTSVSSTTMRFTARHHLTDEAVGIDEIPAVDLTELTVPMSALPRPGRYNWTMELLGEDGEILCEQGGYFMSRSEMMLASPSPTPEVIIVTATPNVIFVTATREPFISASATPWVIVVTSTPQSFSPQIATSTPIPSIRELITPTPRPAITPDR